jgi:hypothetical protein
MQIAIPIAAYEEYKKLLDPGDLLLVRVPREPRANGGGAGVSEIRYHQVRSRLVELQTAPVEKGVIVSSYEDLEHIIDDIAPYVDLVAYNTERGTTPDHELQHLEDYVRRFAQLARSRELGAGWGPTSAQLTGQPELLDLAAEVDLIGLQHQRVLALGGVEQAVSLTRERGKRIRETNPEATINLQLRGDSDAIGDVLHQSADYVDMIFVLTAPGTQFNYRQLFEDVELRGGCFTEGQRSTASPVPYLAETSEESPEAPEGAQAAQGVTTTPEPAAPPRATSPLVVVTAIPSPNPRPQGATVIRAAGVGLVALAVMMLVAVVWLSGRASRRAS